MPWRMIIVLLVLLIVVIFSGFNLNLVDISIVFYEFKNVPLFLPLISAFIVGALVMIPFTATGLLKAGKKKRDLAAGEDEAPELPVEELVPPDLQEEEVAASEKKKKSKKK